MDNLKSGNLTVEIENKKGALSVQIKWIGKSDKREPASVLVPYLNGLIQELKGRKVEVVFTELKFMNSSTVPPIIQFMKDLSNNSSESIFIYNKNSNWQAASFKALETISKSLKNIEVIGK